ncbi:metallophosphoesterase family protein, partial [Escherichia coli]|uniref:metallophosphoesterase family protein n=1 Tax=Escherichia coli TaxID=562 RepID=UPI0028DD4760
DHIAHLRQAVATLKKLGAEAIIHCGDLISPFMLEELARFDGPVHLVFGNNAGDVQLITSLCLEKFPAITLHGVCGELFAD